MAKKKKGKVIQMLSPENYIRQKARALPIYECVVNKDWEESGLADIIVARKHTNGNLTVGLFLADLKCLGIKNAHYRFNISQTEYCDLLFNAGETGEMIPIPYPLAHNIVFAGIEFADDYGFVPHQSFSVAQYILEEDTDDIELIEIGCGGEDGKPLYVRGPHEDNVRANQIIAQLEKNAGPGNYNFINELGVDNFDGGGFGDDEGEWGEDECVIFADRINEFLELLPKVDILQGAEEREHFLNLVDSIVEPFVEPEKADRLYGKLLSGFDKIEIVDEPFDEFIGIAPKIESDRDKITEQLDKVLNSSVENVKDLREGLERTMESIPGTPLLHFAELVLLHLEESSGFEDKVESYHKKFPGYPLIKIFWANLRHTKNRQQYSAESIFEEGTNKFFGERAKLHPVEIYQYIQFLALASMGEKNINCLDILSGAIEEIGIKEIFCQQIFSIIAIGKISFVLSLAEKMGKYQEEAGQS